MIYESLDNIDGEISKITFGGGSISGAKGGYTFGEIGEKNSQYLIEYAIDSGINLFDTAPFYGLHQSEIRLGKYLKAHRDKVKIVSKSGITWHDNMRVNMTNDPKIAIEMLHTSLKNLQTEYIDFYLIHWPDEKFDIRATLEVLAKAKEQKKIKHIGLCNTNKEDLLLAKEICEIDVLQAESNLFNHHHNSLDNIDNKLTMGWGTFDKGILAGTVNEDREFEDKDVRKVATWWKKSNWREKVKIAKNIEYKFNISSFDLALHFSLKNNNTTIAGFKSREQLDKILNSIDKKIDLEIIEKAVEFARS